MIPQITNPVLHSSVANAEMESASGVLGNASMSQPDLGNPVMSQPDLTEVEMETP